MFWVQIYNNIFIFARVLGENHCLLTCWEEDCWGIQTCQGSGTWHQYLASLNEQETLNKIKNNYFVTILL